MQVFIITKYIIYLFIIYIFYLFIIIIIFTRGSELIIELTFVSTSS